MTTAAPALTLTFRALHAAKEGNTDAEYEDAFAGARAGEPEATEFAVAVADGASSSVFARQWARLLADDFAAAPLDPARAWERVAALGKRWRDQVASDTLPWYAQEKLAEGSHAALLVVAWDLTRRAWSASALGDTCLFVLRRDRLTHAFPVARAVDFDNTPALVPTETARRAPASRPSFLTAGGVLRAGDRFLLMTDAIAAWFLARVESGHRPWEELPPTQETLLPWLETLRETGRMRNDDVTVIEVRAAVKPPAPSGS